MCGYPAAVEASDELEINLELIELVVARMAEQDTSIAGVAQRALSS